MRNKLPPVQQRKLERVKVDSLGWRLAGTTAGIVATVAGNAPKLEGTTAPVVGTVAPAVRTAGNAPEPATTAAPEPASTATTTTYVASIN
ncbi:hypothetical protein RIF29_29584 [Crotalaria pallida]|uniref:Uncharacterized protein n=1 Tax=Crotalaria pallida TaxID=3830 RepID=A0AAN9HWD9_CROPI